jgi:hypothetical protein
MKNENEKFGVEGDFKHNEESFRKKFKVGDEIALPNWGGHKLQLVDIGHKYIIVKIKDELGFREIARNWIHA